MDDPAEVFGDAATRERAFRDTVTHLSRRIDLLLSLRFETLERTGLEGGVRQIADEVSAVKHDGRSQLTQMQ